MNDGRQHDLTAAQRRAQDAVRSLARPAADPDFRARLKQDFMSGALAEKAGPAEGAVDPGAGATPVSTAARKPLRPWMVWTPVAAAAVLLVMAFVTNPLPSPQVIAVTGEGTVTVDGRSFSAADRDAYAGLLGAGSRLEVAGGASVDVLYPGAMVMRVDSGTEFDLPGRPGRWIGRTLDAWLKTGEVTIMTEGGFHGNHLAVGTPDGTAVISGTLANVMVDDQLTCICLFEGHLRVESPDADLGRVEAGKRWVLHRDGSAPEYLPIAPPHQEHMETFAKDRREP